jgi:F420-non-reducing hydrogenase small subunit
VDGVRDQGAAFIAALGSLLPPEAGSAAVKDIPDPAGTFYRYTLPASLLRRSREGGAV